MKIQPTSDNPVAPAKWQSEIANPKSQLPRHSAQTIPCDGSHHGNDHWRTKNEVAAYYGMCTRTIERACAEEIDPMPHQRFRGRILFKFSAIDRWLATTEKYRVATRGGVRKRKDDNVSRSSPLPRATGEASTKDKDQLAQGEGQTGTVLSPVHKPQHVPLRKEITITIPHGLAIEQSKPPRQRDAAKRPLPEKRCTGGKHKFGSGLYTRTCNKCGFTQHKNPATGNWESQE